MQKALSLEDGGEYYSQILNRAMRFRNLKVEEIRQGVYKAIADAFGK